MTNNIQFRMDRAVYVLHEAKNIEINTICKSTRDYTSLRTKVIFVLYEKMYSLTNF